MTKDVGLIDKMKLNAIKDPQELVEIAVSHNNPEVCKAAVDKLIQMDLIEDRKAILVCSVVKNTDKESVAKHAFEYCSVSKLPVDVKYHMIKTSIDKVRFESIRKQMQNWLDEKKLLDEHK